MVTRSLESIIISSLAKYYLIKEYYQLVEKVTFKIDIKGLKIIIKKAYNFYFTLIKLNFAVASYLMYRLSLVHGEGRFS